jgi:hypothetical protein
MARINRWLWIPTVMIAWSAAALWMWSFDREPPFKLVGHTVEGVLHPGGYAMISLHLERSAPRHCSVDIQRWIQSALGFRWVLSPRQQSVEEFDVLQRLQPYRAYVALDLPPVMPIGKTTYGAVLYYKCNPLHHALNVPIVVSFEISFEVVAKP